jgi:hypothetical protein
MFWGADLVSRAPVLVEISLLSYFDLKNAGEA